MEDTDAISDQRGGILDSPRENWGCWGKVFGCLNSGLGDLDKG